MRFVLPVDSQEHADERDTAGNDEPACPAVGVNTCKAGDHSSNSWVGDLEGTWVN